MEHREEVASRRRMDGQRARSNSSCRFLQRKFPPGPPADLVALIQASTDPEQISGWFDAAFDASSLQRVPASHVVVTRPAAPRFPMVEVENILGPTGLANQRRNRVAAQMMLQAYLKAGCPSNAQIGPLEG